VKPQGANQQAKASPLPKQCGLMPACSRTSAESKTHGNLSSVIHEYQQIEGSETSSPGGNKLRRIVHYVDDEERVSSRDLLSYVLEIPTAYQTTAHTMRLSITMKRLGWERTENKITIGKEQVRGFFRQRPKMPELKPGWKRVPDDD
jgi:hypothetical protein